MQQGEAHSVMVKSSGKRKRTLAGMHHADLWGSRERKSDLLEHLTIETVPWRTHDPRPSSYWFVGTQSSFELEYEALASIADLMPTHSVNFRTHRDRLVID